MNIMTSKYHYTRLVPPLYIVLFLSALLSSCGSFIYKAPINQGHTIDPKAAAALHKGMTETEVKALLGEPTLVNPLYDNKWAYIHAETVGYEAPTKQSIALTFTHGKLSKIERNL
jgi:outer membrane protein assembly factor BamE